MSFVLNAEQRNSRVVAQISKAKEKQAAKKMEGPKHLEMPFTIEERKFLLEELNQCMSLGIGEDIAKSYLLTFLYP